MINLEQVQLSLRQYLRDMPGVPGDTKIAWENRPFVPPNPTAQNAESADNLWLAEKMQPLDEAQVATNLLELVAIWQIDVNVPVGSGMALARQMAKKIGDRFKPGTERLGNGVQIAVQRTEPQPGSTTTQYDKRWYTLPVWISFRAYATSD